MRGSLRAVVLLAVFIGLPILEIYVIIQVGQAIGAGPTILLLVAQAALGFWLIKREGRRTWLALNESMATGTLPGRELADAAIVMGGGFLLMIPGFITDLFGLFCVLPFTRPVTRRMLAALVSHRVMRYGAARYSSRTRDGVHQIYRDHPPDP